MVALDKGKKDYRRGPERQPDSLNTKLNYRTAKPLRAAILALKQEGESESEAVRRVFLSGLSRIVADKSLNDYRYPRPARGEGGGSEWICLTETDYDRAMALKEEGESDVSLARRILAMGIPELRAEYKRSLKTKSQAPS